MDQKVEVLARMGYAARALVYLALGLFALFAVMPFGIEGATSNTKGALAQLEQIPFGVPLLALTGLGLVGFAIWRLIQAAWDADGHGDDAKGIGVRGALLISVVTHSTLAFFAFSLAFNIGNSGSGGGSSSSKQSWAAWLMDLPAGWLILMLIGAAILGFGVAQIIKGATGRFLKHLSISENSWSYTTAKLGLIARGVTFVIISGFVIYAGWTLNAQKISGTEGIWTFLSQQPFGKFLVILMALGLICFGLYSLIEAKYRRIKPA